jgi:hypothetical protein
VRIRSVLAEILERHAAALRQRHGAEVSSSDDSDQGDAAIIASDPR